MYLSDEITAPKGCSKVCSDIAFFIFINLYIRNDSGHYMCQINTEPMVSQIGMLEVVEAPDILYNETSNDTISMEGSSVNLKCEARWDKACHNNNDDCRYCRGYPEPTITWQREDKQSIVLRDLAPPGGGAPQRGTQPIEEVGVHGTLLLSPRT